MAFFTNTYITGGGRINYFTIKDLEDPLFTSFTFDIDFNTSPLFYTINNGYEFNTNEELAQKIEKSLENMHTEMIGKDNGYDILPLMSAYFSEDGNKSGFGIQQNVYLDQPLYGATEYIYMVDKRNGGENQSDVRYNNNNGYNSSPNNNIPSNNNSNSYKLGDSVKELVNENDKAWAEKKIEQNDKTIEQCKGILEDPNVIYEHDKNEIEYNNTKYKYENTKITINGEEYSEENLNKEVNKYKEFVNGFDNLKRDIVSWVNTELSNYQNKGQEIYMENECVKKIFSYEYIDSNIKDTLVEKLNKDFKNEFENYLFNDTNSYLEKFKNLYNDLMNLFLEKKNSHSCKVKDEKIISNFKKELIEYGLMEENSNFFNGEIIVKLGDNDIEWATKLYTHLSLFGDSDECKTVDDMVQEIMSYSCDMDNSFSGDFTSDKIKENERLLDEYKLGLSNIKYELYGTVDDGDGFDENNPSPYSTYGQYVAAEEKWKNDEYTQANNTIQMALSGSGMLDEMLCNYDDGGSEEKTDNDTVEAYTTEYPNSQQTNESVTAPRTVLDMLGFISGMRKLTQDYPYIIQGITGLDTAYNKHYGIKDPYLGSGDDKITLTCLESIDLRVSSMFNRYFNAIYDRQYRRERVPVNLRRFNCSVYVHDVRNFNPNNENYDNRILELKKMYYSVIEFKFYDCEIVPEETGNIFNDISNEAPSEMKKTNFTFTYGNCVVNFIPANKKGQG